MSISPLLPHDELDLPRRVDRLSADKKERSRIILLGSSEKGAGYWTSSKVSRLDRNNSAGPGAATPLVIMARELRYGPVEPIPVQLLPSSRPVYFKPTLSRPWHGRLFHPTSQLFQRQFTVVPSKLGIPKSRSMTKTETATSQRHPSPLQTRHI